MQKRFNRFAKTIFRSIAVVCIIALLSCTFVFPSSASPVSDKNVKQIVYEWVCEHGYNELGFEFNEFILFVCEILDDENLLVLAPDLGRVRIPEQTTPDLLVVYDKGNIYELKDAVDLGIIPRSPRIIYPLFTWEEYLESINRQILFNWFCEQTGNSHLDIEKFYFTQCGSFDDEKVLVFNPYYEEFFSADAITHKRVGNRILAFSSSDTYMAVFDGQKVYDLDTAYELGLLNDERLDVLAQSGAKFNVTYRVGDINLDGDITVADLVALRKSIMEGIKYSLYKNVDLTDIDGDGRITVSDVVKLRSIIMEDFRPQD
ncbi:MAG TPA: hypothetical protein GXX17_05740 [Clostridiales bacterium]|nr:hypothetical protein [Clostridiales bacterium]